MANARRGEIEAVLDGTPRVLVLTLGALAELESAFGAEDLTALAGRFERGRLSARDAARIIVAGLNGAGAGVTLDEVEAMRAEGGAAGFARIVARLLSATFGGTEEEDDAASPPPPRQA
ncbi:gene transfer agent family protein [Xanthobacter sp. V3C-3]|uniref:gene transfer agent family protein n=1 Tax=Xanthobacter lutulentifluminis TaxID=3119935 RepID=UPI00372C0B37